MTENGLHHSFIKLLQSLQTDTLTVSTQDEKLSQCYIPKERGQPNFLFHIITEISQKTNKKTEVDFLRLKRNVIHLNSTQSHLKTFKCIRICISAYFVLVSKLLTPMTSTPKHSRNMKIIIGLAHCVHFSCIFIFRFGTVPFSKRHFIPVCLLLELPIR